MSRNGQGYALGIDEGEAMWFFGNLVTIKAATEDTGGAYTLAEFLNPPGFVPPPHVHELEDEAFYILDGHADFHCGERTLAAGPGSFVLLPKGVPHWFKVADDGPLRCLQITTPAQFERYVAAVGEPARARQLPPQGPPDLARAVAASERFGVRLLGPAPAGPPR